ncbi:N-chimaerin [Stylophora pistillata]|uniref:N-chimaerin n=1 Tax=Stylophora pistillata TaxID=50429 RepID=A0A2B4SGB8_STYPI|nr:N-chimaerin [Stylophora pistillata]
MFSGQKCELNKFIERERWHLGHIGWDPQQVFDIDRLDEKWKELIGVTDEQMQKKELVDFIFDLVEKRGGIDNMSWDIEMQSATASQKEIKKIVPQAIVVSCEKKIPENKPAHFGNEFYGSLSPKEAEKIVTQYEDGHYLVRESMNDDAPCYALTFRFFGSNKHLNLQYDGKMHYVGGRGFESLDDLVNDGLTSMYLEMCIQIINHRVKGSYSETRVETPSDRDEENLISSEQESMDQRSSNDQNAGKGPLLQETCDVADIPISQRRNLTIHLSGGNEWQLLAERLGLSSAEIRFLDNRVINPCDAALGHARKQGLVRTVGELYDKLVECEFPMWADLL